MRRLESVQTQIDRSERFNTGVVLVGTPTAQLLAEAADWLQKVHKSVRHAHGRHARDRSHCRRCRIEAVLASLQEEIQ